MTTLSTDIDLHFRAVAKIVDGFEKETMKEIAYLQEQGTTLKNKVVDLLAENDKLNKDVEYFKRRLAEEHERNVGCACRTDGFYHIEFFDPTTGIWKQSINDRRRFACADDAEFVVRNMRKEFSMSQYRVVGPGYIGHGPRFEF